MQHINKIISNSTKTLLNRILSHNKSHKDKQPSPVFYHIEFTPKPNTINNPIYYNIIKNYALYLGVKVMYRDKLDVLDCPIKSYIFIGDMDRIQMLFNWSMVTHTMMLSSKHPKDISSEIISLLKTITVIDPVYINKLETHIMVRYKLDYKKYKTSSVPYWHATSKKYHHKRMML